MGSDTLFGHFTDRDFDNGQHLMSQMDSQEFNAIILTSFNSFLFDRATLGHDQFYSETPHNIAKVNLTDIGIREKSDKYFQNDFIKNENLFQLPDDYQIYHIDRYKNFQMDLNLSACAHTTRKVFRKLLGTKPPSLLVIEDLVQHKSIEELRHIFYDCQQLTINKLVDSKEQYGIEALPLCNDYQLLEKLRMNVAEKYPELLKKSISYSASLIRSAGKISKKMMVIGKGPISEHIEKITESKNVLPGIMNLFRSYLKDDAEIESLIEQNMKLSAYYTRQYEETTNWNFVEDAVRRKTLPVDHDLSCELYERMPNDMTAEEIMEKFAILGYLVENDYMGYLNYDTNIWDYTIFSDLLKKKFGDGQDSLDSYLEAYYQAEARYRQDFDQGYNKTIERIVFYHQNRIDDKDDESFLNKDNKFYDHSLPLATRRHNEKIEYYANEVMALEKGTINVDPLSSIKEAQLQREVYASKINHNVNSKLASGQSQYHVFKAIKNFTSNEYDYHDLLTLREQIIEANSQLQLQKFPKNWLDDLQMLIWYHKKNEMLKREALKKNPHFQYAQDELLMINQDIPGKAPIYEMSKGLMEDYMLENPKNMNEDRYIHITNVQTSNPYIWEDPTRMSYKLASKPEDVEMSRIVLRKGDGEFPDQPKDYEHMNAEEQRAIGLKIWKTDELKVGDDGTVAVTKSINKEEAMDMKDFAQAFKDIEDIDEFPGGQGHLWDELNAEQRTMQEQQQQDDLMNNSEFSQK